MGREIKRVPLDFDWPLKLVWKGFVNPYRSQECKVCDGSGLNPPTKLIADDWYDFDRTGRRWCDKITQDEVDALIAEGRLYDFTHRFVSGEGWKAKDPAPVVTAEMVNTWSRGGLGHDAINRWICVETRAKRYGVYGHCPVCDGGEIWFNDTIKQLSENWYEKEKYEPPSGEGWQLWETVSEGSPVSPVFATEELFIEYLIGQGSSEHAAREFCKQGWVMSMMAVNGKFASNLEAFDLDATPRPDSGQRKDE